MEYKPILPKHNDNVSHNQPIREFALLASSLIVIFLIIFWALAFLVDWAVDYISPDLEAALFSSVNQLPDEFIKGSPPQQIELQRMLDSLKECAQINYPLKVYLIDSEDANALAVPGGRILVFSGLLDSVFSENGLAFVLAHEIAHFKNRDHLRGLGRGIVLTAILTLIAGANSDLTQLFTPATSFSQAQYSQDREALADRVALEILHCFYGHVGGATEFFNAMSLGNQKEWSSHFHYFESHPQASQRIDNLRQQSVEQGFPLNEVQPLPTVLQK